MSEEKASAWISDRGAHYLSMERRRRADIMRRNNVHLSGRGDTAMVFAHGFGCDQQMWRFVAPEFETNTRLFYLITLVQVGPILRLTVVKSTRHSLDTLLT